MFKPKRSLLLSLKPLAAALVLLCVPACKGSSVNAIENADISDFSRINIETDYSSEEAVLVREALLQIIESRPLNGYPGMMYPDVGTATSFSLAVYGDCPSALETVKQIFQEASAAAERRVSPSIAYECGPVTNEPINIIL